MQDLLKELEEFAFRGIPDMRCYSSNEPVAREEMVYTFVASCIQLLSRMEIVVSCYWLVTAASSSNSRTAGSGSTDTFKWSALPHFRDRHTYPHIHWD